MNKNIDVAWVQIVRVTVLALMVGFGAGIIGAVLTENYLLRYSDQLEYVSEPLRLSEEKPRALPGTYEEALEVVRTQVEPALVGIYEDRSEAYRAEEQVYAPDAAMAAGVVVTSDGWFVTDAESVAEKNGLVTVIGSRIYSIEKIHEDEVTGLALCKVEGDNLPVVAFGSSEYVAEGDLAFVVPARNSLVTTSIAEVRTSGGRIHATEDLLRQFELDELVDVIGIGAPVTNSAGELIGFMSYDESSVGLSAVRPLHHVMPVIESVLRDGEVNRVFLGATVLNLSEAIGLSDELTRGYDQGVLVIRDPGTSYASAVASGSPADAAGLLEDDIITKLNGETVNGFLSFNEMLLDFEPEDEITLTVDRDGEMVELMVTLGVFE